MLAEGDAGYEGQQVFLARCASCHQINGLEDADGEPIVVEGNAAVVARHAPNLTHLMSRERLRRRPVRPLRPRDRRAQPRRSSRPGSATRRPRSRCTSAERGRLPRGMPDLGLTEEEIDQLVDYLVTLGTPPNADRPPIPDQPERRTTDGHRRDPPGRPARPSRRQPTAGAPPTQALGVFARPRAGTGWKAWLTGVDHKKVGIMYGAVGAVLLRRRRPRGAAHPGPAGPAQRQADLGRPLQPGVHHARRHDGLPRRSCRWARRS